MNKIVEKFLRYVAVETTSNPDCDSQPSSEKELVLSKMLVDELKSMGIADAELDKDGYVMATIPSNTDKDVPVIGFIAHVDTAPDAPGADIKPQFVENYDGGDICINKEKNMYLRVSEFPEMAQYKGDTIITTDGTTLLGADDKAGVAEIMCAAEYIMQHPEFKHGTIKIGFTPDEEIGRGVDAFNEKKFGAQFAYTMDGGMVGELEYENFNAAAAKIHIQGRNIHPGYAKGKMLNATQIGMELASLLPAFQRPEYTCDYEGFFHLTSFSGTVEEADIQIIIRDHSMELFKAKKDLLTEAVGYINKKFGNVATMELKDQYYNMRSQVEPHFQVVEKALKAIEMAGVTPKVQPIRGGTDGAMLSFRGLPCPNIFAGGHNFHGKYEYVPVGSMEKAFKVILNIISLYAE
ncbi:MAG: peptidase T [Bacteroidales bacterium]|nr:peptidase T [Bacteroidales bacterium]